jgi:hypothetical protein
MLLWTIGTFNKPVGRPFSTVPGPILLDWSGQMEQIKVSKLNPRESGVNVKKLLAAMSFDAAAIHESKDWPYLWPKENVEPARQTFTANEETVHRKARNRRFLKIGLWGAISLLMYLAIFLNQGIITKYFTQGGFFTLAIVATALSFALVHGNFAGHILEDLNYKAANREKDEQ